MPAECGVTSANETNHNVVVAQHLEDISHQGRGEFYGLAFSQAASVGENETRTVAFAQGPNDFTSLRD